VTRIEFHIDELVLVGFDPVDRNRIGDPLERALRARLMATDVAALVRAAGQRDLVRAPDVSPSVAGGPSHDRLADGIGAAIVSGIVGGSTRPTAPGRPAS
jgi:hypothetical protein